MIQIGGADKIDILKSITHDIIITLHTNVESDVTTYTIRMPSISDLNYTLAQVYTVQISQKLVEEKNP